MQFQVNAEERALALLTDRLHLLLSPGIFWAIRHLEVINVQYSDLPKMQCILSFFGFKAKVAPVALLVLGEYVSSSTGGDFLRFTTKKTLKIFFGGDFLPKVRICPQTFSFSRSQQY